MSSRTRYLQLSDSTMMEYIVNETVSQESDSYIHTILKDGNHLILSTLKNEVVKDGDKYVKRDLDDIISLNTILHTAVPVDEKSSELYYFVDNDYLYIDASVYDKMENGNIIVDEYSKYCNIEENSHFNVYNTLESLGYDKVKLYFVSGYDFSDIFSGLLRLTVPRADGSQLYLCNFIYNKGSVYKFIKFMTNPIIFGNFIYDKYIEIAVPSVKNFFKVNIDNETTLGDIFLGKTSGPIYEPNIRLLFSYTSENDKTISNTNVYTNNVITKVYPNTSCIFSKTNSISGIIPTQKLTSDNLGVYIADSPDYSYLEFYGTWNGKPLSNDIVKTFNVSVKLYDRGYVKKESTYEVGKDYKVGENVSKWLAIHEITAELLDVNLNIHNTETYSMTQTFGKYDSEPTKFYYRPIYFDTEELTLEDKILHIKYVMRLVNIEDGVQFLKQGSLSITDLSKFNINLTRLNFNTSPYKVFNKIVESKQNLLPSNSSNKLKSKYVKVFYDVSQVLLDENGESFNNGTYTLNISRSPKNYKFVFKQRDFNNNIKYFDLSDAYYKLYVKESNGNEIIINPTYSSNMNIGLGELEFNIGGSTINRLKDINPEDRKISIICYNPDGSLSTMYEMSYNI